jgi:hypothetical protein
MRAHLLIRTASFPKKASSFDFSSNYVWRFTFFPLKKSIFFFSEIVDIYTVHFIEIKCTLIPHQGLVGINNEKAYINHNSNIIITISILSEHKTLQQKPYIIVLISQSSIIRDGYSLRRIYRENIFIGKSLWLKLIWTAVRKFKHEFWYTNCLISNNLSAC